MREVAGEHDQHRRDRAAGPDGAAHLRDPGLLRGEVQQVRTDAGEQVEEHELASAVHLFELLPGPEEDQHVEEQVPDAAVQEHRRDEPPDLAVENQPRVVLAVLNERAAPHAGEHLAEEHAAGDGDEPDGRALRADAVEKAWTFAVVIPVLNAHVRSRRRASDPDAPNLPDAGRKGNEPLFQTPDNANEHPYKTH